MFLLSPFIEIATFYRIQVAYLKKKLRKHEFFKIAKTSGKAQVTCKYLTSYYISFFFLNRQINMCNKHYEMCNIP